LEALRAPRVCEKEWRDEKMPRTHFAARGEGSGSSDFFGIFGLSGSTRQDGQDRHLHQIDCLRYFVACRGPLTVFAAEALSDEIEAMLPFWAHAVLSQSSPANLLSRS
jgi:hypothetical protein